MPMLLWLTGQTGRQPSHPDSSGYFAFLDSWSETAVISSGFKLSVSKRRGERYRVAPPGSPKTVTATLNANCGHRLLSTNEANLLPHSLMVYFLIHVHINSCILLSSLAIRPFCLVDSMTLASFLVIIDAIYINKAQFVMVSGPALLWIFSLRDTDWLNLSDLLVSAFDFRNRLAKVSSHANRQCKQPNRCTRSDPESQFVTDQR